MIKRIKTKGGKKYEYASLEINGVQPQLIIDIENICANLGIKNVSEFLRPKLREIRDAFPQNMRQAPDAA